MRSISASAPGKVVLFGEYAVLSGAPAIAMAVNRRATAQLAARSGDISVVTATGVQATAGEFHFAVDGLRWATQNERIAIVDQAWRFSDDAPRSAVDITLDSSGFLHTASGEKMGIGSSAAVTAALSAALAGSDDAADIGERAYRAHDGLQGGVGSGIDVACSLYGGVIEYRMPNRDVTQLAWPRRLNYKLIYSGASASTTSQLTKLHRSAPRPSADELQQASTRMAAIWRRGSAADILQDANRYVDVLRRFSDDHDLGIFAGGHEHLMNLAETADVFYKPCGAGGGDIGIAMATDRKNLLQFVDNLGNVAVPLDLTLCNAGVSLNGLE